MKSVYILLIACLLSCGLSATALLPAGVVLQNTSASDAHHDEEEMNDDENDEEAEEYDSEEEVGEEY